MNGTGFTTISRTKVPSFSSCSSEVTFDGTGTLVFNLSCAAARLPDELTGNWKLSFLMAHQMTVASNHENLEVLLPVSNLKLESFPWRLLTVEGFGGIIHPLWLPWAW